MLKDSMPIELMRQQISSSAVGVFIRRAFVLVSMLALAAQQSGVAAVIEYPTSRLGDVVDDYHGTKVADPYRWLEDPDSAESKAWIESENKVTQSYLEKLPSRKWFKDRLTQLWNFDKYGVPTRREGRFFFTKQTGLANQPVLYWSNSGKLETPVELVDPNKLSEQGTTSLSGFTPSDDGKMLAYGLSGAGSDWVEWHVKNVETGKDTSDVLKRVKFTSPVFTKDGAGVYYSRFPETANELKEANYYNKLYFHKLGTEQSADKLIVENPKEKEWMFHPEVSDDGRYLVITISKNTDRENLLYYKDLQSDGPIVELINTWGAEFSFIDNEGSVLYLSSNENAPRGKIIAIDLKKPEKSNWREIVPQGADTLRYAVRVKESLVAHYVKDAHAQLQMFDLTGKNQGEIPLPGMGMILGVAGRKTDDSLYYSYTGFTQPRSVFRYDLVTKSNELVVSPKVDFNPGEFETKQVFVDNNGARIPVFLVWRKGLVPEKGPHPVHLYAYGGFSAAMLPYFSPSIVAWTEKGGVYAHACLRGGGEYGEDWHKAGMRENKQNVFDDFISVAKWLSDQKCTDSNLLSVSGASNGGLLIGAVITQQPQLFGAAAPEVGVLDMLRFHKFTIGHAWAGEYGSSDDATAFKYLYKYSPLHNVRAGTRYPATLVLTGDHDDRVVPAHSFKFAAALQAAQAKDGPPVLIRIETQAGHGAGKPTSKIITESADKWSFLWDQTGGAAALAGKADKPVQTAN